MHIRETCSESDLQFALVQNHDQLFGFEEWKNEQHVKYVK